MIQVLRWACCLCDWACLPGFLSFYLYLIKSVISCGLLELPKTEDIRLCRLTRRGPISRFLLHKLPAASCYLALGALAVPNSSSCSADAHLSVSLAPTFPEKGERYLARLFSSIFFAILRREAPNLVPNLPMIPTFFVLFDIFINNNKPHHHCSSPSTSSAVRPTPFRILSPPPSSSSPTLPPSNASAYLLSYLPTSRTSTPLFFSAFSVYLATLPLLV